METQYYEEQWEEENLPKSAGRTWKAVLLAFGCLVILAAAVFSCVYFFVHVPTERSCTEDAVCKLCGIIVEEAQGHAYDPATCDTPKTCSICDATKGKPLDHEWGAATCENPQTCELCGETNGEPAGHQWKQATCTEKAECTVCGEITGETLGHSWQEATCEAPETCRTCGATEGDTLPHDWREATCKDPKTCAGCGKTEGGTLPHNWQEATYTAPKTCIDCGITEGEPLSWEEEAKQEVDVESQVLMIREQYDEIVSNCNSGAYRVEILSNGATAYYDANDQLRRVDVHKTIDGIGSNSDIYGRSYYFTDGRLIFAYYTGPDVQRFYFYEDRLMRWRCTVGDQVTNYDMTFSEAYLAWEETVLNEAETYLGGFQ